MSGGGTETSEKEGGGVKFKSTVKYCVKSGARLRRNANTRPKQLCGKSEHRGTEHMGYGKKVAKIAGNDEERGKKLGNGERKTAALENQENWRKEKEFKELPTGKNKNNVHDNETGGNEDNKAEEDYVNANVNSIVRNVDGKKEQEG